MSTEQAIGATIVAWRSNFNAYLITNASEKAGHAVLLANLVPLEALSWRDVFNAVDAVAEHLATVGGRATRVENTIALSDMLHRCATVGTNLCRVEMAQSVGMTSAATPRTLFDIYLQNIGSEKADHATLLRNVSPLDAISWQDVFCMTDAVVGYLSQGGRHSSVAEKLSTVLDVLKRCVPAHTNIGDARSLWHAIKLYRSSCSKRHGMARSDYLNAAFKHRHYCHRPLPPLAAASIVTPSVSLFFKSIECC